MCFAQERASCKVATGYVYTCTDIRSRIKFLTKWPPSLTPPIRSALAVLALLFERPMHPYEMAATLKQRHKGESIKIRYGSLYTVIELLVKRGFITAKRLPARASGRSGLSLRSLRQGTTSCTPGCRTCCAIRERLSAIRGGAQPVARAAAGGSGSPAPAPGAASRRGDAVRSTSSRARTARGSCSGRGFAPATGRKEISAALRRRNPISALALVRAELAFVNELVRRITEEGWGPLDLWRELQADCARQHDANARRTGGCPCKPIGKHRAAPTMLEHRRGPNPKTERAERAGFRRAAPN